MYFTVRKKKNNTFDTSPRLRPLIPGALLAITMMVFVSIVSLHVGCLPLRRSFISSCSLCNLRKDIDNEIVMVVSTEDEYEYKLKSSGSSHVIGYCIPS